MARLRENWALQEAHTLSGNLFLRCGVLPSRSTRISQFLFLVEMRIKSVQWELFIPDIYLCMLDALAAILSEVNLQDRLMQRRLLSKLSLYLRRVLAGNSSSSRILLLNLFVKQAFDLSGHQDWELFDVLRRLVYVFEVPDVDNDFIAAVKHRGVVKLAAIGIKNHLRRTKTLVALSVLLGLLLLLCCLLIFIDVFICLLINLSEWIVWLFEDRSRFTHLTPV